MTRILLISSVLILLFFHFGDCQKLTNEISLLVENDAFTSLTRDQYYSSGIFANWRNLRDSTRNSKLVRTFQINHRIYTPSKITKRIIAQTDRPYAGVFTGSMAYEFYRKQGQYLKLGLELGWMGPKSKVGKTQQAWHRWFNMPQPQGWDYQIQDSPAVILKATLIDELAGNETIAVGHEINTTVGTIFNYARYNLYFRLGRLRPLTTSAFTNGVLGGNKEKSIDGKPVECYFFYAPAMEYVFYNATLQGNLWGNESFFTTAATKWVWQHRYGFMWSWSSFDLGITAYIRSKENPEAHRHTYVGILLKQRF